jgi:S-adenosylmethionine:tRNA ribosyltransferase-isomerase
MIAANLPLQRPNDAKLLLIDTDARITHAPRSTLAERLRRYDLVVANDAITLPASLAGIHSRTGHAIEVRLAGCRTMVGEAIGRFTAVVLGAGDFRTRTEDRPLPPALESGDGLVLGPLRAVIERLLDHPRLIALRLEGSPASIWDGIARHGRPIQYAHMPAPLALWDVWTPIAGAPLAFEPPSAGFVLDWKMLAAIRARGTQFATLTHAAGLSSTGDAELDRRLPLDEPYRITVATARAITETKRRGGRVIAVGTTVVRALEHAVSGDGAIHAGAAIATQRLGAATTLRVVDAIVSGTHDPGTSHYELLRAFADDLTLRQAASELDACGYRTHEFGDSVFIERSARCVECATRDAPRLAA